MNEFIYNLGYKFHKIALSQPERIAIETTNDSISFIELEYLSNKIAHYLLENNIKKHSVVAICNNKSIQAYAIMIACLKIGATYTNLDSKSPVERLKRMISTCNPSIFFYFSEANFTTQEILQNNTCVSIDYTLEGFKTNIEQKPQDIPSSMYTVSGQTPAYIMFTSGSTGFPKGVVIAHAQVLRLIEWSQVTYNSTCNDAFTNINPMHFDNSVFDFYASLFVGATLLPIGEQLTKNPRKMLDELNELKPTIWFSVPSMLVYTLNMRALKHTDLPTLRIVSFGGEGFPKNQLRKLWDLWHPRISFINVYGPTECTCICSSYTVTQTDIDSDDLLPLGTIAPNFTAYVVNEENKLVVDGEVGELLIGGENVGLGYFNNPEKTKEVFIQNPFHSQYNQTVYASGDLVTIDSATQILYFCGRKDNQIKRMGYRIELEEIESGLQAISYIQESAVVYITTIKPEIIACISSFEKNTEVISKELSNFIPHYMMPDRFVFLDSLPKNQNGKIDRLQIKELLES